MANFTVEVDKKVATILRDGGVFLTQTFDPRESGNTAFSSNSDAQEWAEEHIALVVAEEAAKKAEEDAKKAAFEAEEAARLAALEPGPEATEEE
jgi:hypothetical protein